MDLQAQFPRFMTAASNIWTHGYLGLDVAHLSLAILVFVLFFAMRERLAGLILSGIRHWLVRNNAGRVKEIVDALAAPISFAPVVCGAILAVECLHPTGRVADLADKVSNTLATILVFWCFVALVKPMNFLFNSFEKTLTPAIVSWIVRGIRLGLILCGLVTVLESWGIKVGPIIAGVGVFGVAIALGAKDMFSNLIGGLVVLAEGRYQIGDWVEIEGVTEGTIAEIGFRSTTILRPDKSPVYVPNGKLSDAVVTNHSANPLRRIFWTINLANDTTTEQLRVICRELQRYLDESPEFVKPPEASAFVRVDAFTDTAIKVILYCFTRSRDSEKWLAVNAALSNKVTDVVSHAGAAFASEIPYVVGGSLRFPERSQPKESDLQHVIPDSESDDEDELHI